MAELQPFGRTGRRPAHAGERLRLGAFGGLQAPGRCVPARAEPRPEPFRRGKHRLGHAGRGYGAQRDRGRHGALQQRGRHGDVVRGRPRERRVSDDRGNPGERGGRGPHRTQVPVRVGTFRRGRDGFRHGSDGHADRPGRRPAGAQPRADADDERGWHGDGFRHVELRHALYYGHGTRRGVPRGGCAASVRLLAPEGRNRAVHDGRLPDADGQQPAYAAYTNMENRDGQNAVSRGRR